MATVRIPPVLRPSVGGEKELSADGSSVGAILLWRSGRAATERNLLARAQTLSAIVGQELETAKAALRMLATSPLLDSGDLAAIVLRRASPLDVPSISWRALSGRAHVVGHRHVHGYSGVSEVRVTSLDDRPLPLQVDGDYIGDVHEAVFSCLPQGILVVS